MGAQTNKTLLGIKGAAFVELAIVLPLLLLLALGVFDFARAIHAKNMITNMSREGANLASRTTLSKTDIMNAIAYTAQPLNMNTNGMIYVTEVTGTAVNSTTTPIIQSQSRWQNRSTPASRIGANPGDTAQNLSALNLTDGETVYTVEVFYRYRSVFYSYLGLDKQLYSMSVF
ncbi:MAG: TadE/TadG family type IV pilus assembly protein [Geobacteraceae bacterium]|nr:TadE/TadG family type IV pilus assembly protein [Geobacteraceae bacterium]